MVGLGSVNWRRWVRRGCGGQINESGAPRGVLVGSRSLPGPVQAGWMPRNPYRKHGDGCRDHLALT
jgi:hypothetical protein